MSDSTSTTSPISGFPSDSADTASNDLTDDLDLGFDGEIPPESKGLHK